MLWLFAGGGLAGLLLGWWFRVPALIAVSALAAVISMAAATHMGLGLLSAAGLTFALLGALQVGYLAGLMLSCVRARAKFPLAERYSLSGQGSKLFQDSDAAGKLPQNIARRCRSPAKLLCPGLCIALCERPSPHEPARLARRAGVLRRTRATPVIPTMDMQPCIANAGGPCNQGVEWGC